MNRIRTALGLQHDTEAGLSIVEVVVAMMVFAVITVGAVVSIGTVLTLTSDNRSREVAANLASQDIDTQRAIGDVQQVVSTASNAPIVQTINGTAFKLTRKAAWVTTTGIVSQCGTADGSLLYKTVNDTVTWGAGKAGQTVTSNTVIAPNSKINNPDFGTILISVKSITGSGGTAGVPVSVVASSAVTGNKAVTPAIQPAVTSVDGCSIALKVVPGTYKISLSAPAGQYRSEKQDAAPVKDGIAVSAGGSASVSFTYDPANDFQTTYGSTASITPTNLDTTWVSTYSTYNAAAPLKDQYLSPIPSGYQVVAGTYVAPAIGATSCLSTNPASWPTSSTGTVGKPGSAYPNTVSPGVSAVTVPMALVKIKVSSSAGVLVASNTTPQGDDPGCNVALNYSWAVPGTASNNTYTFAVPFGTWTFSTKLNSTALLSTAVQYTDITPPAGSKSSAGLIVLGNTVYLDPRSAP